MKGSWIKTLVIPREQPVNPPEEEEPKYVQCIRCKHCPVLESKMIGYCKKHNEWIDGLDELTELIECGMFIEED